MHTESSRFSLTHTIYDVNGKWHFWPTKKAVEEIHFARYDFTIFWLEEGRKGVDSLMIVHSRKWDVGDEMTLSLWKWNVYHLVGYSLGVFVRLVWSLVEFGVIYVPVNYGSWIVGDFLEFWWFLELLWGSSCVVLAITLFKHLIEQIMYMLKN